MPRPLFVFLAALLCCGLALAQSEDRIEVFGGYSYLNPDSSLVSPNHVNGWNGSVNFKARPWIGFVADFSGFYPSHTYSLPASLTASGKTYTFLFGPQVSLPRGRFAPFARFLIGASHVTPQDFGGISENLFKSNNALSLSAGGGLDYSLNGALLFAVRQSGSMPGSPRSEVAIPEPTMSKTEVLHAFLPELFFDFDRLWEFDCPLL